MPPETLTLDPLSEDATNTPFELINEPACGLVSHAYPAPPLDLLTVGGVDMEGDRVAARRHRDRTIPLEVELDGEATLGALQAKVAKIAARGGTLKRVTSGGLTVIYDLLAATGYDPLLDITYHLAGVSRVKLEFLAKPYGRGLPVTSVLRSEAALPYLRFLETVPGDVPALGDLVVTDTQGKAQWWAKWGLRQRFYDAAATAGLFFEAEGRTVLGGSTTSADAAASGGSKLLSPLLAGIGTLVEFMSTQAAGGGAQLTHQGSYELIVRARAHAAAPTSDHTLQLGWQINRYVNPVINRPVSWTGPGWRLLSLGQVRVPPSPLGPSQWEGRLYGAAGTTDQIAVDYLLLIPVEEGSGEATGNATIKPALITSGRDSFEQADGAALNGLAASQGGTWATTSASDPAADFTIDGFSNRARRGPGTLGRLAGLGATVYSDQTVQADVFLNDPTAAVALTEAGVLARYVDANNFLWLCVRYNTSLSSPTGRAWSQTLTLFRKLAGTQTTLVSIGLEIPWRPWILTGDSRQKMTLRLQVSASGHFFCWLGVNGAFQPEPVIEGHDSALDVGGALASGKAGLADFCSSLTIGTRYYGAFQASADVSGSPAIPASGKLRVRHDRTANQLSGSGLWAAPVSRYEGDYLTVPPGTSELIVKASRITPSAQDVALADDIQAQLTYTPRFLAVPR